MKAPAGLLLELEKLCLKCKQQMVKKEATPEGRVGRTCFVICYLSPFGQLFNKTPQESL